MNLDLSEFVKDYLYKAGRPVPARLQAALALLERLRDFPSLSLNEHLASRGSSGLESHETFGKRVHDRLALDPVNKNHGRRSSNLQDWGQSLLDILATAGFNATLPQKHRHEIVDSAQLYLAKLLRDILEQDPLTVRIKGRSAEAVIRDLLRQAEAKGKIGDVAQYLVGAKLMLRLKRDIPVHPANKSDRKSRSDLNARSGDFVIENAVIEVAVGLPDEKHLAQVAEGLEDSDTEVWLLTRADRVATWNNEIEKFEGIDLKRVVVTSVESFVGQNITELGEFSIQGKISQLLTLIDLYNTRWISQVGTPGIRIVAK